MAIAARAPLVVSSSSEVLGQLFHSPIGARTRWILVLYDSMMLTAEVRTVLEGHPEVELGVLFGSTARSASGSESDLDLGLKLRSRAPRSVGSGDESEVRAEIEHAVRRSTGRAVDLVDLDSAPPLLRFEIARDGAVLVERRPHAWADFQAKAMLDWWDFAPLARRIHKAAIGRLEESLADGAA